MKAGICKYYLDENDKWKRGCREKRKKETVDKTLCPYCQRVIRYTMKGEKK